MRSVPPDLPLDGLPVLPLRDVVVLPGMTASLIVGRAASLEAVKIGHLGHGHVLLLTQHDASVTHPTAVDFDAIGTLGHIAELIELPDGHAKILVEGVARASVSRLHEGSRYLAADIGIIAESTERNPEQVALMRSVTEGVERLASLDHAAVSEYLRTADAVTSPERLADSVAALLPLSTATRRRVLCEVSLDERLRIVLDALEHEISVLEVQSKLRQRVDHAHRSRPIALDLPTGHDDDGNEEIDRLEAKFTALSLPEVVGERVQRELRRLRAMPANHSEAVVIHTWLEWVAALPWGVTTERSSDLHGAADVLDLHHFGLNEVKDRVLEYLAVSLLTGDVRGPILCLVGPPGVGKTSLARAMADAVGRPFARIALGGVRDEAEIRGHRRAYIGATPGRMLQAMRRAGSSDPLVLLDEIDKMAADMRGDPAAALLEVLDPEQNFAFNDHYLDVDYDLSRVMFVCTANQVADIPIPLRDRLELVEIKGYTEAEKFEIARRYLVPKQREAAGLKAEQLSLDDAGITAIIRDYTREAGVRALDREIARVCRKLARGIVEERADTPSHITVEGLDELLGPARFDVSRGEDTDGVGLVKGLSVSSAGGELLDIEVAVVRGKGALRTTGRPGEMLKESAEAAMTWLRTRASELGLAQDFHEQYDVHIHYPGLAGGVEGPSAGTAMATAIASAFTGIPVRHELAMTGEISLRGRVLPVGGIKDKLLAAHRAGVTQVLIPSRNVRDLHDLPDEVRASMEITAVSHMDEVLGYALVRLPAAFAAQKHTDDLDRPHQSVN